MQAEQWHEARKISEKLENCGYLCHAYTLWLEVQGEWKKVYPAAVGEECGEHTQAVCSGLDRAITI